MQIKERECKERERMQRERGCKEREKEKAKRERDCQAACYAACTLGHTPRCTACDAARCAKNTLLCNNENKQMIARMLEIMINSLA
jgi:hypothetical protein